MSKTIIFQPLSIADLKTHQGDLLHIADLNALQMAEKRVLRSEAKKLLTVARAMASLVSLILLRDWDRVFLIVDQNVFMHFPCEYLPMSDRLPVPEIVGVLADFTRWSDARLTLVVRGLDVDNFAEPLATNDTRVVEARATLAEFCSRKVISGDSLNETFLLWVRERARVCEFEVMAGSVEGACTHARMPPRAQILAPLPRRNPATPNSRVESDPRYEVAAHAPYFLIETPTGDSFLVAWDERQGAIAEGSWIEFPRHAKRKFSSWYLIDEPLNKINAPQGINENDN